MTLFKNILLVLLSTIWSLAGIQAQVQQQSDFSIIRDRIVKDEYKTYSKTLDAQVAILLSDMNTNGAFSNIDYARKDITKWPPSRHLDALKLFALAYVSEQSQYYKSTVVRNTVCSGLNYWLYTRPTSDNWWYNVIDTGQKMGLVLLIMDKGWESLPKTLVDSAAAYMLSHCGDPEKYLGANKLDVALHWLYRGLALRDSQTVKRASEELFEPTKLTVKDDGIQHDFSYGAHRHQIYIGGYGEVYVNGTVRAADQLRNTDFAMPLEKVVLLDSFIQQSYLPVIRGSNRLFNVMGRSITRINNDSLFRNSTIETLERLKRLYPVEEGSYEEALQRLRGDQAADFKVEDKHMHYWRTDYTLHTRTRYSVDSRGATKRTARSEMLNGENLKGYFMSDGAMSIHVDGEEYSQIFPIWDWSKIPGTTIPSYPFDKIPSDAWPSYGRNDFYGGVTDGKYGVSGFLYNDTYAEINTSAKKAWFFFDGLIVCLGAGINSSNLYSIATTLNQVHRNGKVVIKKANGSRSVIETRDTVDYKLENTDWIHHDKVGYQLLDKGPYRLDIRNKKGNWKAINNANGDSVVQGDVFCLWKDHGIAPHNERYAYIVIPDIALEDMSSIGDRTKSIVVQANSDSLQIVGDRERGTWQIVSYTPSSFSLRDMNIELLNPCVLMLETNNENFLKGYITDPTQTLDKITLIITGANGTTYKREIPMIDFNLDKSKSGRTVEFEIKLNQ